MIRLHVIYKVDRGGNRFSRQIRGNRTDLQTSLHAELFQEMLIHLTSEYFRN